MTKKIQEVDQETWSKVNKANRDMTEEFLKQSHLSPETLKQYKSGLMIFFVWVMENCDNKPIYKLKPRDAIKYQSYLVDLDLSPAAIKFKRACVSSLCGYVENFYDDEDEYKNFRNIYNKQVPRVTKQDVREKKPLDDNEYKNLIDTLEKRGEWQMVAYIKFTYSTACRRAEARQLLKEVVTYKKAVDPKTKEEKPYYFTHKIRCKGAGKIGKVRPLVFDDEAMDAIKKWLEVRGEDDNPYVFVSKDDNGKIEQIRLSTFNYWCSRIFSKIVGRRVHPHQFREQRATHMVVVEGKDIKAAQALLGHNNSSTTEIYVIRDADDAIDDAFGD